MFNTVMNFIFSNVSIIISLIALILSAYNFLYSLHSREKKIKIDIVHFRYGMVHGKNLYIIQILIQNCSQLPISICNFSINDIFCIFKPSLVYTRTRRVGNEVISRTETKTFQFPINLSNLESTSGYLEFKTDKLIDLKSITFNVYTNRGVIKNLKPDILVSNDDLSTM